HPAIFGLSMRPATPFPRWGILLIDLVLCLVALGGAYLLRFNFEVPEVEWTLLKPVLPVYIAVRLTSFLLAGTHRIMVRHTGTDDARRIFLTVLAGSLAIAVLSAFRYAFMDGLYLFPRPVIIIDFMGAVILLIATRIGMKLLHLRSRGAGKDTLQVVLFGAGEAGLIAKRTLEREGSHRYKVVAFVDDDVRKTGKRLEGAVVLHTDRLEKLLRQETVDQLIVTVQQPDPEHRRRVVDTAMKAGVKVLTVPPVSDWINGQLSAGQMRAVRIEDLLGRPVIRLDDAEVRARFAGRRVLVTGAAGSIGSELVRQLAALGAKHLLLVDMAESPLYDLEMELAASGHAERLTVRVADVRDEALMERLFSEHRPEVVFHAAAYKHVPLMELQPLEAVRTNILGTRVVASLACRHGVSEFVLVSTDKAVNPTSVMGATKRVAELLVQALADGCATRFVTTRFGNVLGSSGSVIPLFRRQIEQGGPVTVTDPEVTRYFMTIPEACRLVLEAATMGQGGEVYVFDMGDPVRIADLAERMVRLSGREPGVDIEIVYSGLRPGEKLYEELLAGQEDTLPTHHPRILIGKVRHEAPEQVLAAVDDLATSVLGGDVHAAVRRMKVLVPEYRSHNSVFANFDAPAGGAGGKAPQEAP
ncbi:MAG TPA: nucleoside-diphosphate sugar epimerase/dehydratase, partial [Flavobacteriales bacterium]|nr:nucleoside-diphosphate sugar epimerase/dehydratase [Flavobacteriales bacterium]